MAKIHYLVGDATEPVLVENKQNVIVHCCNDMGAWGAGFVIPLAKKYPETKRDYQTFIRTEKMESKDISELTNRVLGKVVYNKVGANLHVANLIGQSGIYINNGLPPIRYEAIGDGFRDIIKGFKSDELVIHCPRIGAGLAGGDWKQIEKLLDIYFVCNGSDVYVYDLKHEYEQNKWKGTVYENI